MNITFNHIALRCENIDAVASFFIQVIGLKKGARPSFSFPGFWQYSLENNQLPIIHIFSREAKFRGSLSKNSSNNGLFDYIAFTREGYQDFINHLKQLNILLMNPQYKH